MAWLSRKSLIGWTLRTFANVRKGSKADHCQRAHYLSAKHVPTNGGSNMTAMHELISVLFCASLSTAVLAAPVPVRVPLKACVLLTFA